ncbi:uncharacterized protein VP01_480g9 [Puccinia sorghi]|uniref:Xylanolytic transcriptional activator regulatory domain-containing protein n=1 Tax=Puccinia sorghi TaxID=27349 RepID=A0A0L6UMJ5_9BASI|nr:uncharacterized protein VP01_480g9 [Puccinia sorghi]
MATWSTLPTLSESRLQEAIVMTQKASLKLPDCTLLKLQLRVPQICERINTPLNLIKSYEIYSQLWKSCLNSAQNKESRQWEAHQAIRIADNLGQVGLKIAALERAVDTSRAAPDRQTADNYLIRAITLALGIGLSSHDEQLSIVSEDIQNAFAVQKQIDEFVNTMASKVDEGGSRDGKLRYHWLRSRVALSTVYFAEMGQAPDLKHNLIKIYFQHFHPLVLIVHPTTFYALHNSGLANNDLKFRALCLLMLSVASRWSSDPSVQLDLTGQPQPSREFAGFRFLYAGNAAPIGKCITFGTRVPFRIISGGKPFYQLCKHAQKVSNALLRTASLQEDFHVVHLT